MAETSASSSQLRRGTNRVTEAFGRVCAEQQQGSVSITSEPYDEFHLCVSRTSDFQEVSQESRQAGDKLLGHHVKGFVRWSSSVNLSSQLVEVEGHLRELDHSKGASLHVNTTQIFPVLDSWGREHEAGASRRAVPCSFAFDVGSQHVMGTVRSADGSGLIVLEGQRIPVDGAVEAAQRKSRCLALLQSMNQFSAAKRKRAFVTLYRVLHHMPRLDLHRIDGFRHMPWKEVRSKAAFQRVYYRTHFSLHYKWYWLPTEAHRVLEMLGYIRGCEREQYHMQFSPVNYEWFYPRDEKADPVLREFVMRWIENTAKVKVDTVLPGGEPAATALVTSKQNMGESSAPAQRGGFLLWLFGRHSVAGDTAGESKSAGDTGTGESKNPGPTDAGEKGGWEKAARARVQHHSRTLAVGRGSLTTGLLNAFNLRPPLFLSSERLSRVMSRCLSIAVAKASVEPVVSSHRATRKKRQRNGTRTLALDGREDHDRVASIVRRFQHKRSGPILRSIERLNPRSLKRRKSP